MAKKDLSSKGSSSRGGKEVVSTNDGLKWTIVWILFVAGGFGNYYFSSLSVPVRIAASLVLFVLVVLAVSWTEKGQIAWSFVKGARQELRRVHWQSRPEIVQLVVRILFVVAITAVILWLCDMLFMRSIGLIS